MNQNNPMNKPVTSLRVHSESDAASVHNTEHEETLRSENNDVLRLGVAANGTTPTEAEIRQSTLTSSGGIILKRCTDVLFALPVVLLVLPPLAVLVRVGIWIQSPGPLFFRQERCGQNLRKFTILKFRTMNVPESGASDVCGDSEKRIFPLGKILRKTKLDEIPQFVNVLLGTMSVVGPRPHHFADCETFTKTVEAYPQRSVAKPGITGLAQYSEYRGEYAWNCIERRVENDLSYIRNWSIGSDLMLILKTATVIVLSASKSLLPGFTRDEPMVSESTSLFMVDLENEALIGERQAKTDDMEIEANRRAA